MPKSNLPYPPGDYALVAERIALFYERHPEGRIITRLHAHTADEVIFEARVYRAPDDRRPAATGWAAEREGDGDINTVACLENTETSAIGRALANLGFAASRARPRVGADDRGRRPRPGAAPARVVGALSPHQIRSRDALGLLATAARHGLDEAEVRSLREQIEDGAATALEIERIEAALRGWLVRQRDRAFIDDAPGGDRA